MEVVRIGDGTTAPPSVAAIGVKAANLARMAAMGLCVPPAFVLPIELCAGIMAGTEQAQQQLTKGVGDGLAFLERATGRHFGDHRRPLLVSVRSGAARSMPGMLATVLDVGCTSTATHGLIRWTGNPRFAWDCRRRFIESYVETVLAVDAAPFTEARLRLIADESAADERELDGEALERLCATYESLVERRGDLPDDPMRQLLEACRAVYASWMSERARTYRRMQELDGLSGTAVTVQAMVFGNRSCMSGSGVAFSRDPSSGAARSVIDVLFEAQGEDVVSGRRTPQTGEAIVRLLPAVAAELQAVLARLEREFRDVQDIEFTMEDGELWILQSRPAKRTPRAALRIAVDLVREGLIAPAEALRRLDGIDLAMIAHTRIVSAGDAAARGTGGSSGAASGRAAFDSAAAERIAATGDPVILIRPDTSTADVAGFAVSAGILTAAGGRTAHAALVARQMGKPCVVGCSALTVDAETRRARIGALPIQEGDWLSIDGGSGDVFSGQRDTVLDRPEEELAEVERWRAGSAVRRSA